MDAYRSHDNSALSRQFQIVDKVRDYGFLAPRLLAREEELARMLRSEVLESHSVATDTRQPFLSAVRRHLGDMLIRIGTRIQDRPRATVGAPSTINPTGSASV
jgi:hypothetical protein